MALVRTAFGAVDLGPDHPVGVIQPGSDRFLVDGLPEGRPAAAAIVLVLTGIGSCTADDTAEDAWPLFVIEGARKRPFRRLLLGDAILLWSQMIGAILPARHRTHAVPHKGLSDGALNAAPWMCLGFECYIGSRGAKVQPPRRSSSDGERPMPVLLVVLTFVATSPSWAADPQRSEEHTSELQSRENLVCRLLLEEKN